MSKPGATHIYKSTAGSLPAAGVRSPRRPGEDLVSSGGEERGEYFARPQHGQDGVQLAVILRLIRFLKEL